MKIIIKLFRETPEAYKFTPRFIFFLIEGFNAERMTK